MFHQRNGFYAERLPNGSVRLVKKNRPSIIELAHGVTEGETVMDHSIPAAEWASIVAAVSAGGETSETYAAARALHDATDAGGAANGSSVPDQFPAATPDPPGTVLDPETGIEEPVTTGRIPDAEFVEPPLMAPAASPDERLREENLILRAKLDAVFDEACDCHDEPHPLMSYADNLRHRLSTAGHLYAVEGFKEILRERDELRAADERLREAAAWLVELAAAAVCEPRRFAENETELQWKAADAITATRAALAAADREAPDEETKR